VILDGRDRDRRVKMERCELDQRHLPDSGFLLCVEIVSSSMLVGGYELDRIEVVGRVLRAAWCSLSQPRFRCADWR
jgi:hypothetical protein